MSLDSILCESLSPDVRFVKVRMTSIYKNSRFAIELNLAEFLHVPLSESNKYLWTITYVSKLFNAFEWNSVFSLTSSNVLLLWDINCTFIRWFWFEQESRQLVPNFSDSFVRSANECWLIFDRYFFPIKRNVHYNALAVFFVSSIIFDRLVGRQFRVFIGDDRVTRFRRFVNYSVIHARIFCPFSIINAASNRIFIN